MPVRLKVELANPLALDFQADYVLYPIGSRGLGDNVIAVWNETTLELVRCYVNNLYNQTQTVTCVNELISRLDVSKYEVLSMTIFSKFFVVALKYNNSNSEPRLKLIVIEQSGTYYNHKYENFEPQLIKFNQNNIFLIMHAIGNKINANGTTTKGLFYIQFKPADPALPPDLDINEVFDDQFCPVSLVSVYRTKFQLYIGSYCPGDKHSVLAGYYFDVGNIKDSRFIRTQISRPLDRSIICANNEFIHLIEMNDGNVYSYSLAFGQPMVYKTSIHSYNVTVIHDALCDSKS